MAITVKHTKVSTVPDTADTSLVRPSDWNADHTLTGLGTMAEQNANNVSITGGSISGTTVSGYIPTSAEGVPNGVATLDSGGQIPLSQIPPLGDLNYQGSWNASTNTPTLTSSVGTKGYYYVVSVAGTTNLNGITDWQVGDWAVFNGSVWQKIDNTDSVTSVNGYTGAVVLTQPDIAGTVPTSRTISTGTGLTGGGDLSANRTISFSTAAVGTWAATPSSANLAAAMTDETGSGSLVFANSPTLSSPLIDNANPYISFGNGSAVTVAAGRMWYNGSNGSWNMGMGGGNITQQVGEELFVYGKASSAITDSPLQIVYKTGTVGSSGTIQFAPTVSGLTDDDVIVGVATEAIPLNGFGRVTCFGIVHGITTNGTAYGETWADGDTIWYNPVTGNPTKTKPTAPNVKCQIGTVITAGSGGSGSFQVEIIHGTSLGGTDSNVNIVSPTAAQILTYDSTNAYWKNTSLASGTGISTSTAANGILTVNNTAPDQTVVMNSGTGISVTGTYPNFTVTNTAPSSGGTVTSVGTGTGLTGGPITSTGTISLANTTVTAGSYTYGSFTVDAQGRLTAASSGTAPVTSVSATSPVASSGGTTPTISISQASGTTNGYLSSTDWTTFNNKQPAGTYVTSVSATSPVTSTGGTTPTIAIPQASGSASGYLSSTDWTTFNNKGSGTVTSVSGTAPISVATGTTTPAISISQASGSTNGYLSSTDWTTFNSKASPFTYTSTYVPYGQGTTTPNQSSSFTFDANNTLNAPQVNASNGIHVNSATIATSYSIPSGSNAMSAGPISIASGVTVTVPSGNAWVIV